MTVGGWIEFACLTLAILFVGFVISMLAESNKITAVSMAISVLFVIFLLIGMLFYYNKTEAGKRGVSDEILEQRNISVVV